jgi:hypothetical protein
MRRTPLPMLDLLLNPGLKFQLVMVLITIILLRLKWNCYLNIRLRTGVVLDMGQVEDEQVQEVYLQTVAKKKTNVFVANPMLEQMD